MAMAAAIVAMATTAVSAVMSGLGAIAEGYSAKSQADFQATMAEKQGELSELSARSEAANIEMESQRLRANQVAQASAAGVDISSSSLWDVIAASQKDAEAERQSVLRTGRLNAEASKLEAANYRTQGSMAKRTGTISGFGSLLTGVANSVSLGNKMGLFDSKASTSGTSSMVSSMQKANSGFNATWNKTVSVFE